jgi:hypothetical protein
MPRTVPSVLAAACALALLIVLSTAATAAAAKGVPASIRVVASDGRILADRDMRAGTTSVATSPRADCFGPGTGGSGDAVRVAGPTPLGLLARAARRARTLRPLLITDAFSFGLGLCSVGGLAPSGEGFWQLRVDHESPEVGGDAVKLRRGDEVLWYLAASFPAPDELWLRTPRRATAGTPFAVQVFSYDEAGKRRPARGVTVSGGGVRETTNAAGRAQLVLERPARLVARGGGLIPSNRESVCLGRSCPRG